MAKRKFDISTNNVETVDSDPADVFENASKRSGHKRNRIVVEEWTVPFLNSDANTTVTTTNEERRADIRSWCPFCGATLQGLDAKVGLCSNLSVHSVR